MIKSNRILVILLAFFAVCLTACGGGTGKGGTFGSAETLTFEGWESYKDTELDKAEELFNNALSLDPSFSEAFNGLGWLNFLKAGQETDSQLRNKLLQSARENFLTATRADPRNADAYVGLSGLELALGNYEDARISGNQALSLDPVYFSSHDNIDFRDVHLTVAEALFFLGRFVATPDSPDPDNVLHHLNLLEDGFEASYLQNQLTPPDLIRKIEELQAP